MFECIFKNSSASGEADKATRLLTVSFEDLPPLLQTSDSNLDLLLQLIISVAGSLL